MTTLDIFKDYKSTSQKTDKQIADLLKTDRHTVCKWLNGQRKIPLKYAMKIYSLSGINNDTIISLIYQDYV